MTSNSVHSSIRSAAGAITWAKRWDHFLARWGVNRSGHRVEPGLYGLGSPTADSPVFVTANYTLSFNALRSDLAGIDGYIVAISFPYPPNGGGGYGPDVSGRRAAGVLRWKHDR